MKTIKQTIKAFKDYLRLTKQEVQIAAGNQAFFANFYLDLPTFKSMLKDYNREFHIIMRDGTQVIIKNEPKESAIHKGINWDA